MSQQPTMPETAEDMVPPMEAGKSSPVERMVEVITAPVATMRSIAARPDILVPMLTIVILSVVTAWLTAPRIDVTTDVRAQMIERDVPAEVIERQIGFMEKSQRFMMPVMAALSPVMLVVIAGVLLLAFRMMGGGGSFVQALSIVTYAWIPGLLKGLILTGMILLRDGPVRAMQIPAMVPTNLGFLFSPLESPAAFTLAAAVDLVTIWMVVLMGIGFAFATGFSRAKGITIVFVVWAVVVLGRTGLALLTSSMG